MARPAHARDLLLDAALALFRERGYSATTVDELCARAGVTKGAFFHHFATKDDLALAVLDRGRENGGAHFRAAAYHQAPTAKERILAYVDLRIAMLDGPLAQVSCLAGTLVQEVWTKHPDLRDACGGCLDAHIQTLEEDFRIALRERSITDVTASGLAAHTEVVLQGGFVLAKARSDVGAAVESLVHLRRYLELLLADPPKARRSTKGLSSSATSPSKHSSPETFTKGLT